MNPPLPEIPDDKLRLYALLGVVLLEVLAVVALTRYVDRTDTLPATVVPCRHSTNLEAFRYMTNNYQIYWFGTNHP